MSDFCLPSEEWHALCGVRTPRWAARLTSCSFIYFSGLFHDSLCLQWWGELVLNKPSHTHPTTTTFCLHIGGGKKNPEPHFIYLWLHMHAVASLPSSIIAGAKCEKRPESQRKRPGFGERDEYWEGGWPTFPAPCNKRPLFLANYHNEYITTLLSSINQPRRKEERT